MSGPAPEPMAEGVWRITTPMPHRPRSVHAYLVALEGNGWMLLDGGIASEEAWSALDRAVGEVAGGWGALRLHVVSHMHQDHVGLCDRVGAASGAPLAMGALDAERFAHAAAEPQEEAEYRAALLRRCGVPSGDVARLAGRATPPAGYRPAEIRLPPDGVALAGAPGWRAIGTPGHTAGHVSLVRDSDRLLLAGDAILPRITPTLGVNRQRSDPVGDYLATLDLLDALAPPLALAGHGEPIHAPAERIGELRAAALAEGELLLSLLGERPRTVWELVMERYAGRELPAGPLVLALRETLAHLERLAALGGAEAADEGEVRAFLRA